MCVNIIKNVTKRHMPAERKRQKQKAANSYSAVILSYHKALETIKAAYDEYNLNPSFESSFLEESEESNE